ASVVIGKGGTIENYPLALTCLGTSAVYSVGDPVLLVVRLMNNGKHTIHIPVSGDHSSVLPLSFSMHAANSDRLWHETENTATYPIDLVSLAPGESHFLAKTIVPWVEGKYTFRFVFRNAQQQYWKGSGTLLLDKDRQPKLYDTSCTSYIDNVWVGCIEITGGLTVGPPDEDSIEYARMKALEELARDRDAGLAYRITAVSELVSMKHIHAVRCLCRLEKALRSEQPLHGIIMVRLYELVFDGAGYAALSTFIESALDKQASVQDRLLAVEALRAFVTWPDFPTADIMMPSEVTPEEKKQALAALTRISTDASEGNRRVGEAARLALPKNHSDPVPSSIRE
ncbi:MAG: hypothetical protein JXA57_05670, partial [Armatimonadetes bacterium]|nr:hypothetical protein [Armatimonadota bacterium]